ncbi:hypothetical protein JHW43_007162 [Diplocarpon mali]|nr:hypothetical protein JHW43_007162 [Diplocarpon mali]
MWPTLFIGAGVILLSRSSSRSSGSFLNRFSWADLSIVQAVPWYGLASVVLVIRHYQGLLARISYFLLLFYWFVWVSGGGGLQFSRYIQIIMELFRSSSAQGGETDHLGRHWTINIAEVLITAATNELLDIMLPNWLWSRITFQLVLTLFVFGQPVFQMFLQRQITRISRINRAMYRWRDYGLERIWLSASSLLKNQLTKSIKYSLWWACFQTYQNLTPDIMMRLLTNLCTFRMMCSVFYGYAATPTWVGRLIRYLLFYQFWIRELSRFSNPDPPPYKYTALEKPDHIRLILLHPRFGFRPVSCSMLNGPHMRLLFYEAVSYTWGSPERSEEIQVDGCTMMVTKSAYEILAASSSQFLPQLLWIDAICIDQDNTKEKEVQVPLMDKIYSNALFTTIFLGQSSIPALQLQERGKWLPYRFDDMCPPDDQSRRHFETGRLAFDIFNEFRILREPILRNGQDVYEMYDSISSNKSRSKQWLALLTLLQHPWFARVWVVQEVALSPRVQVRYGDEVIDWEVMASAIKMIHNLRHFRLWLEWSHGVQLRHAEHSSLYNIIRMDRLRNSLWPSDKYSRAKDINIADALTESFYFTATNPRDQVYGLMSLCMKDRISLPVDYEAPVESVYLNAATELISRRSFGILFGFAGLGNRSQSGSISSKLPSWVPDWTDSPQYDRIRHPDEDSFDYRWRARRGQIQQPVPSIFLINEKILLMSVTFVDTIADVGPALFDTSTNKRGNGVIDEMRCLQRNYVGCIGFLSTSPYARDPYDYHGSQQSLLGAFHHTLVTDHNVDMAAWVRGLGAFHWFSDTSSLTVQREIYTVLQSMDHITMEIESHCGGRRLFVGDKKWMGLCPPGTEKGDLICAVTGLTIPIILRKASDRLRGQYQLVGECYCHGLGSSGKDSALGSERTIEVI